MNKPTSLPDINFVLVSMAKLAISSLGVAFMRYGDQYCAGSLVESRPAWYTKSLLAPSVIVDNLSRNLVSVDEIGLRER
eukprot:1645638-Amphidinium_carterae.1